MRFAKPWLVGAGLIVLFAAGPAGAQPEVEAKRLFSEGQRLLKEGKVEAACAAFDESVRLVRTVGALLNSARCHATKGEVVRAEREYREAAAEARAAGQRERAEAATALADDLAKTIPRLRVQVAGTVPGQTVYLDDEVVPPTEYGVAKPVDPGPHELRATAPGRKSWQKRIELTEPTVTVVTVPQLAGLEGERAVAGAGSAAPDPEPASRPRDEGLADGQLAGIVVGSVGIATAIAGGVFGALAIDRVDDAESDRDLCPNRECTPEGRERIDGATQLAHASTGLLVAGGALVVGGVLLFVLADDTDGDGVDRAGLSVLPYGGRDGGGIVSTYRF